MLPKTVNYSCCLQFAQTARGAGFLSEQAKEDTLKRYGEVFEVSIYATDYVK